MYKVNALTIYDITVTLLRHFSARQRHFKRVHAKIKTIYSKMDYIYEFHNVQYILPLMPVCMWKKYVNFLMCRRHYACYNITHLNMKYLKYN